MAECDLALMVFGLKTAQDDEDFFMIHSRSVHLRLVHFPAPKGTPNFISVDFEGQGLRNDLKQASMEKK